MYIYIYIYIYICMYVCMLYVYIIFLHRGNCIQSNLNVQYS